MATNVARGSTGEAKPAAKGLAIGETDAHVFNCPACARPLSEGTSKCPGCGVRLIMGVTLRRAGVILALGIVLGVLLGGAATASAITVSLQRPVAAAAVQPSAPPVTAAPSVVTTVPVSAAFLSALSGTAVVNGRIAVDTATLTSALDRPGATTIEIARALRSLAADAALGVDLAGRLEPWPAAASVALALDDLYRTMGSTARAGLRVTLTDDAGYRKSGADMLTVLAALGDADAASRSLAATVDLELPPVVLPILP